MESKFYRKSNQRKGRRTEKENREIMRELTISDRPIVDKYFEKIPNRNFYHYFPYIFALSKETPVYIDEHLRNPLSLSNDTLLFACRTFDNPNIKKKVLIAPYKVNGRSILFDKNYIYNLKNTIDIKNFKANIKKFDREHPTFEFGPFNRDDALEVVNAWYKSHKDCEDFYYTNWFIDHKSDFPDIHANIGYIAEKPVAFSLWGELTTSTATHIISKTKGTPYLQDKMRDCTYTEMIELGFIYCNDGGDNNIHELSIYKLKLRPEFIIPIWSWEK